MGLKYTALKKLKVGGSYRMPGDDVPEAAGWRNLSVHVSRGAIAVTEVEDQEPTASKPEPEPEPEPVQDTAPEQTKTVEPPEEDDDPLAEYETGHGWYELPGLDRKVRRDEALEILESSDSDE